MNPKEIYKSNKEFKERTKLLFLSSAREKFGTLQARPSSAFKYFIRGVASGVAFMLLLVSAATYADQTNVGTGNILYPLKRSQEAIKVAFAKQEEKPALHLELAKRRLDEIKEVKSKDPASSKVASLVTDLKNEISNSYETIQENTAPLQPISPVSVTATATSLPQATSAKTSTEENQGNINPNNQSVIRGKSGERERETDKKSSDRKNLSICESWSDIIGDDDVSVEQVVSENPDLLDHFNSKCQTILENFNQNQNNSNSHKNDSRGDSKKNSQEKSY